MNTRVQKILFLTPENPDQSLVSSLMTSIEKLGYQIEIISTNSNGRAKTVSEITLEINLHSSKTEISATVVLDFGHINWGSCIKHVPGPTFLLTGDMPQRFFGASWIKLLLLQLIPKTIRARIGLGEIFYGIKRVGRYYDYVLTPDPRYVGKIRSKVQAVWFPYWFDEYASSPEVDTKPTFDVVTNMSKRPDRAGLIERLESTDKNFSLQHEFQASYKDVFNFLKKGVSVLNWSSFDEVTIRYFETLGLGRVLFTNSLSENSGVQELFQKGVHFFAVDELSIQSQIESVIRNPRLIEAAGKAGKELIFAKHLSIHRARTVHELIQGYP